MTRVKSVHARLVHHGGGVVLSIPVQVQEANEASTPVEYRWDRDTDILTAHLQHAATGDGPSGSVDIEGSDGSWLIFDVAGGRIRGVEVAVWPPVRKRSQLQPPGDVADALVTFGKGAVEKKVSALEVNTALAAEADSAERTIHFKLGPSRTTRTVRIARDLLLDIDGRSALAGVWLLDVPPFPEDQ
jgi:hypothetical protein